MKIHRFHFTRVVPCAPQHQGFRARPGLFNVRVLLAVQALLADQVFLAARVFLAAQILLTMVTILISTSLTSTSARAASPNQAPISTALVAKASSAQALPKLSEFRQPHAEWWQQRNGMQTAINEDIQKHLKSYLRRMGQPIAASVLVDVKTGMILGMVQGRAPHRWGSKQHSALYAGFPAASLFKSVVAAATFDFTSLEPRSSLMLRGGCAEVDANGQWLHDGKERRPLKLTLRRAYGRSCNGFFAKLAVSYLGLGVVADYARRFGWGQAGFPTDLPVDISKMRLPNPAQAGAHTVGRFAAGFGDVGMSPIHAAWMALTIAHNGEAKPIRLAYPKGGDPLGSPSGDPSRDSSGNLSRNLLNSQHLWPTKRLFPAETGVKLRELMDATVLGGTAHSAFRQRRFRHFRRQVGGKTGTLTGRAPAGLTTWFIGLYPIDAPEVAVASVVVNKGRWMIKGSHLAAESLWAYRRHQAGKEVILRPTKVEELRIVER